MEDTLRRLLKFRDERNWEQFHSPAVLARTIVIEASKLLEQFQWKDKCKDKDLACRKLANIICDCLLMTDALNVDAYKIIDEKIISDIEEFPKIKHRKKLTTAKE